MEKSRHQLLDIKYRRITSNGIPDKGLAAQLQVMADISLSLAIIADKMGEAPECNNDSCRIRL